MLVYGDGTRLEAAREKLAGIERGIEAAWRGTAGLARHAELLLRRRRLLQRLLPFRRAA